MLLLIGVVLLAVWVLGFFLWHLGTVIWLALVAAVGVFIWHWAQNRSRNRAKG